MNASEPPVSIIVPTYNEAADIRPTLEALLAIDYPALEILVVDDSTDATPEIVRGFESDRLRLLSGPRRGRAAARNLGIRRAQGAIVLILNADVLLPPDMIRRLLPHYAAGADYVLVESRVRNLARLYPRYVQASHILDYAGQTWINWTEGFSCRREAALAVGLVPEGEAAPLVAGEDGWFGDNLEAAGFRKRFALDIVVEHVAPERWADFWAQRVGRGRGTAQILVMRHNYSLPRLLWAWAHSTAYATVFVAGLVPPLIYGYRLARHSPRGLRDWLPLAWARAADMVAQQAGFWQGFREIAAARHGS